MESPESASPPKGFVVQEYFVVFLDVLGQRAKLRELVTLPTNQAEYEKMVGILKQTYGFIQLIRRSFHEVFTTVNEPSQLAKLLPSQLRTILNDLTKSKIHYYGISDSFVVAVPLGTTDHCEPVNGIHSALLASCWTQLLALDRKHAVRGGIDVGIGLEENGEIYGSALERAYTLESQIAARPRVVVGEELIHYLEYVRDQQPTTLRQEVAKLIATRCLTFIKPDIDGRLILDFLGESSRKALSTVVQPDMFKKAYDFVNDEFAKWSKAGDTKLASRYDELRSYFEAYKAQWGL